MKAKFLKIAGVKSEKEFYKKYPTEAAFFKAHPEAKELKKAQVGSYIGGEQDASPEYQSYQDYANLVPLSIVGKTQEQITKEQEKQAAAQATQQGGGGGIMDALQGIAGGLGSIGGGGGAKYAPKAEFLSGSAPKINFKPSALKLEKGKKVKKAQGGATAGILSGANEQKPDVLGGIAKGLPLIGNIVGAIGSIKQMKQQRKELEKSAKISDVALQASRTQPERTARRYTQQQVISPNEVFIPGGTTTEILAEYGASIGGTPTEIQNMYNPGDLYSNLGYEPLSESDIVKQYRSGGAIPKAKGGMGFSNFMSGGGGQAVSNLIGAGFSQAGGGAAAGSQIGGAVGGIAGLIPGVGPVAKAIAEPLLSLVGGGVGALVDAKGAKKQARDERTLKQNMETIATESSMRGALGNYSSFVKNGGDIPYVEHGWVSHDWQPQVITHFGEHSMEDLLKPPADADMLRTGGNIRQNTLSQLDQYAFGGSLKTHWGGRAEVDSYNPYLPATGETLMLKGDYHSQGGIGISYGSKEHDSYTDYAEYGSKEARKKATVEAENGEPVIQLPDSGVESPMKSFALGGQQNANNLAMTVFGALKINKHAANEIGDKKAEGLTFKKFIAGLNKEENKANNKIAKANEQLEDLKVVTPFDRLKLNSLQATIQGEDQKLKDYAVKKVTAAEVQNAYNETAEEYGVDADALAKGKIKPSKDMSNAKYGIKKAQGGIVQYLNEKGAPSDFKSRKKLAEERGIKNYKGTASQNMELLNKLKSSKSSDSPKTPLILQSAQNAASQPTDPRDPLGLNKILPIKEESYVMPPYSRESFEQGFGKVTKGVKDYEKRKSVDSGLKADRSTAAVKSEPSTGEKKKGKTDWLDFAKIASTQLANILRKPLQEDLDPSQLVPEMLAKAQNQLEPVQAQTFQPLLDTPFDVSFQDRLNENQASFNALLRNPALANNPAALSALAANKYQADSQVLADQFRTNQALRAGVFSKNRDTLNDAALKNLAILDQQYVRQQKAIDNTQGTDLAIAKSISDKIAKNRLENRTFAAYSNLFPQYGFNRNMMALSQAPTFFQNPVMGALAGNELLTQLTEKKNKKKKKEDDDADDARFGKRLKKQLNNGSIVKSLKNI